MDAIVASAQIASGSKTGVRKRMISMHTSSWARARTALAGLMVVASLVFAVSAAHAQGSGVVVRGNQRVEAETIRNYFTRTGRTDAAALDEAIQALFATGLFRDVRASREGGSVVVTVVENPIINTVTFEAGGRVDTTSLRSEVQSRSGTAYSEQRVQQDVQRIQEIYRRQGRNDVRVDPKITDQGQGRVNLVFEINAGERARIERISFVGNRAFTEWRLKEIITTGETNLFSFLRPTDVYDPERISVDQELLRRFYLRNGYADFRMISANANFDRERNAFQITFTFEEGEQYRIGRIDIESGIADVNTEALRRFNRAPTGSIFNGETIDRTVEDMTIELSRAGRPFLIVRPRAERDPSNRVVNLVYTVDEGSRLYVERINIRGNTRTMDQVIRREIDMAEGDAFNRVLVDRAERRLNNLNYFEPVRISREPGSGPDRVVLNVGIQEKATGELNLGAGYSSTDGIIGDISVSERNFLGRGQFVRAGFGIGQFRQNLDFSFTEPYFMDRRLAAGFDVFLRRNLPSRTSPFRQEVVGAGLRLGVELVEDVTLGLRYRAYEQRVQLPDSLWDCNIAPFNPNLAPGQRVAFPGCLDNGEASLALKSSVGRTFVSMPGLSLVVNKLDNNREPRQGFYGEINLDVAGAGGDSRFVRTTVDARYYQPIIDDIVFMVRGQAGNIAGWGGSQVRLVDSFFRGGDFVRGFELSGIGARDLSALNPRNDSLGNTSYVGATAEIQFNIPFLPEASGVRTALFVDAGTVSGTAFTGGLARCGSAPGVSIAGGCFGDDNRIRASYGASLIWRSPLGPLRFDFAQPISRAWYDRTQFFRFSGGSTF